MLHFKLLRNNLILLFLLLIFSILPYNLIGKSKSTPRTYNCFYTSTPIRINGQLDEKQWQNVPWSNDFVDITGNTKKIPEFLTKFKMLWDDKYCYIAAILEENHIWATLKNHDDTIYHDNDFEVFIDPDGDGLNYYEFEINALGTTMDLFLKKPYNKGGHAQMKWNFKGLKSAVKTFGTLNDPKDEDSFWVVEMAIPWENFNDGKVPKNNESWRINFSRVEWQKQIIKGKYQRKRDTINNKLLPENNWVWSPQGAINMHIPEKWGYVKFIKEEHQKQTPRYWMWIENYSTLKEHGWSEMIKKLSDAGITGLLVSADTALLRKIIPIAQSWGLEIHAWFWTMNRQDAKPEWLSVNALGKSLAKEKAYVDYYKFLCPALPEVKTFLQQKISELTAIKGLSGIHFDYIRYVDVFLPKELQPKYNLQQNDIMPEYDYGYHPALRKKYQDVYGKDPFSIKDYPHDKTWLDFRLKVLDTLVIALKDQVINSGLIASAAVFPTPDMSRKMVRQNWDQWHLNYYFPMIYQNFYGEKLQWIEQCVKEDVEAVGKDSKVFAGLYLPGLKKGNDLTKAMTLALKGGADGISFFDGNALDEKTFNQIKQFIQKH